MSEQISAGQKQLLQKAKEATDRQNYDYAIQLLKQLTIQLPNELDIRRRLRANELIKFKNASGMARKMAGLKVAPMVMKGKGAIKKDANEAIKIAEDILEIDPTSDGGNEVLALAAEALDLPQVAILAYETLRDSDPKNLDTLKHLGSLYLGNSEYEKAQTTFDAAIKLAPNDGEALKGMKDASAKHASESGSWEEGSDYRESLKDLGEAEALEKEKRVVKSADAIDEELTRMYELYNENQTNLATVKKIAELLERKDDLENAVTWYQYAFQLSNNADPEIEKRLYQISLNKVEVGIQQKRAELEQADDASKEQVEAELQALLQEKAQYELQTAKERVQKYPNDKGLRYELGNALFLTGAYKEAVPELQQSINQPNVRIKALHTLGLCYQKRNILDLAIKQFETAKSESLTMDNLKKEVIYNLGLALDQAERKDEALEQFKEIYEVDYHYKDVAERVESAYGA
ncbi:MAG: tetratricopeptide repeat protein [Gammaproteobacteria bacterium]|nr:tetratricopeptide repeat protein [Gammaproteobacteria bacterium]